MIRNLLDFVRGLLSPAPTPTATADAGIDTAAQTSVEVAPPPPADGGKRPNRRRRGGRNPRAAAEARAVGAVADSVATADPAASEAVEASVADGATDSAAVAVKTPRKPAWRSSEFVVESAEGKTRFHDLGLRDSLMHGIAELGFEYCTPIQAEVLPHTLAGKDAIGKAQTGTGKTAAFLITIIAHLQAKRLEETPAHGSPRALIIAPTRELAVQIGKEAETIGKHCHLHVVTVFGGMDYQKQQQALETRVDILVATPGRLLDFERKQVVRLGKVEILVLDEADRMLDMGFIPDVRRIVYSTPHKDRRQTLFFSATFPDEVKRLASQWTREAVEVEIDTAQVASSNIDQVVYIVTGQEKYALLYNLITQKSLERVIIFANRREETRWLADRLRRHHISCALFSGEVAQATRSKTLEDFRNGKIRALVATDVAGRGLHVDGISHVVNYNLPMDAEDYVHRIGRTGRAGESGTSISFACEEDSFQIPAIQEFIGHDLKMTHPPEELLLPPPPLAPKERKSATDDDNRPRRRGPGRNSGGGERRERRPRDPSSS